MEIQLTHKHNLLHYSAEWFILLRDSNFFENCLFQEQKDLEVCKTKVPLSWFSYNQEIFVLKFFKTPSFKSIFFSESFQDPRTNSLAGLKFTVSVFFFPLQTPQQFKQKGNISKPTAENGKLGTHSKPQGFQPVSYYRICTNTHTCIRYTYYIIYIYHI